MIPTLSEDVARLFRRAEKGPLVEDRGSRAILDSDTVKAYLPQRDPFLFLDRVTLLDTGRRLVAARYDLARAEPVFAGHFPGRPLFPGVLQIESIGQAGIVLGTAEGGRVPEFALTHVLAARFIRPVLPGGELEVVAQAVEDGLFRTVVGQVLRDGKVCAAAAVCGVDS